MFCGKCGHQLDNDAMFCDACGARVNSEVEPINVQNLATTATSPAMESINSFYSKTKSYINNSGLDGLQIASCILAGLSAIFSLITYNYIYNWITALCAGFLLFLCIKKEQYNTILFAIPYTVYFGKELIYWLAQKAPYLYGKYMLLGLLFFGLDAASVVLYWLLVTDKISQKKIAIWVVLITLGLNTIGIIYNLFSGILYNPKHYIYYLGLCAFFAIYMIMIVKKEFMMKQWQIGGVFATVIV